MAVERVQRRLAAILAADVVGYSRLIGADETGTRLRFNDQFDDVVRPAIDEHRGRLVKTMGDGFLVEFGSVVDAVQCAADIQANIAAREAREPEDCRMLLRIGVHLGDVIVEGEDIHGDGVNIAARLEGLAVPGGVCASGMVYEGIRNKLSLGFEDLGSHTLKNIADPVRVYRVRFGESAATRREGAVRHPPSTKPSIAVLPFANMSGDPEQEYFADGITEDLITDLSKISGLFVVARNSTFSYKGKQANVCSIAEDLSVGHVLEGSVRRAGEKIRINAQLIDAQSGGHLWAERYDRDFQDVFALQDEITAKIVAALEVTLTSRDRALVNRKPTESAEAYEHLLKARSEYYRYNPDSLASAIDHLESAIALDPGFAEAYGYLSYCYFMRFVGMWPGADADLTPAVRLAETGVALDPDSAVALTRLAWVQGFTRRFDESLANFEKAISLDPNNAETYAAYSDVLTHWGDPKRSLEMNARAISIDTVAPPSWEYHFGNAYMVLRRYDEAIAKLRLAVELVPKFLPAHLRLACVYAEAGRLDEAKQTIATVLELAPNMTIAYWDRIAPHRTDEQRERFFAALRVAGLPE